ncbi:MAG: hypothetical protein WD003_02475 [Candidatus Paceibacterota bacterium]
MVSYSRRQQFKYGSFAFLFVFIVLVFVYFFYFTTPESCFDGKLNQDETQVDCGGECSGVCAQGADVVVEWSRILLRTTGEVDVIALLRNPNRRFATEEIAYTFSLYDKDNLLITERRGVTFANKQETFLVLLRDLNVGERIPQRVFVELIQKNPWKEITTALPQLSINNRAFLRASETVNGHAQLSATITNTSFTPVQDISVSAVVFDTSGNAIAASSTYLDELPAQTARMISFSFPHLLPEITGRTQIFIRVQNTIKR